MKHKVTCFILAILCLFSAFAYADEEKKADVVFSLQGGTIQDVFTMQGQLILAQTWKAFFTQTAFMVNSNKYIKEYGASIGFGLRGDHVGLYLFGDALYRGRFGKQAENIQAQLRPAFRLTTKKAEVVAFYAIPVTPRMLVYQRQSDPTFWYDNTGYYYDIEITRQFSMALKYYGGEFTVVPFNFLRLFGEGIKAVNEDLYRYRAGLELKLFSWLALTGDYTKFHVGPDLQYVWGSYEAFRAGINILFGSEQQRFGDLTHRKIIRPQYPIVVTKNERENLTFKIADILKTTISADTLNPCVGEEVNFYASVIGGNPPYTFNWNFNDGTTANTLVPKHKFLKAGTYCVQFTVNDSTGHSASKCLCLNVIDCAKTVVLNVSVCDGVTGVPGKGIYTYKLIDNSNIIYSYELEPGYKNLVVMLDGVPVSAAGNFIMDRDHNLTVCASKIICVPAKITKFVVSNTNVEPGMPVTFTWETSHATAVTLNGSPVAISGSITVNPTVSTTYHLKALNNCPSEDEQIVTVSVNHCEPVVINSFTLTKPIIKTGETATLNWNVSNASHVYLDGSPVTAVGSLDVSPTSTHTYKLTADNNCPSNDAASVTLTVYDCEPVIINSFTASRPVIKLGEDTTISWNVSNTTGGTVLLDGIEVPAVGSKTVSPTSTHTYTLQATNNCPTEASASITVTVDDCKPVVIESFTSTVESVKPGESVTFSWNVLNAGKVYFEGNLVANPGSATVTPTADHTYTLDAENDCPSAASSQIKITINNCQKVNFLPGNFVITPLYANVGQTVTVTWTQPGNATKVTIYKDGASVSTALSGTLTYTFPSACTVQFDMIAENECSSEHATKAVVVTTPSCDLCSSVTFHSDGSSTKVWNNITNEHFEGLFDLYNKSKTCKFTNIVIKWKAEYQQGGQTFASGSINVGDINANTVEHYKFKFDYYTEIAQIIFLSSNPLAAPIIAGIQTLNGVQCQTYRITIAIQGCGANF